VQSCSHPQVHLDRGQWRGPIAGSPSRWPRLYLPPCLRPVAPHPPHPRAYSSRACEAVLTAVSSSPSESSLSGLSSESSAGLNTFSYHHRPTVAASESRLQRSLSSVEYDVTSFRLRDTVPLTRLSISARSRSERHFCEGRRCGPACAPTSTALGLSAWPVGGAVAWHGAARWTRRHESRSLPPLLERRTWPRLRGTVLLILSAISGFIPTAPAQHMRHCASL
jgi:hypothetical protein